MEATLLLHFLLLRNWRKIEVLQIDAKYHHYAPNTLNYSKTAITPIRPKSCVQTENRGFGIYGRKGPRMQYFRLPHNLI